MHWLAAKSIIVSFPRWRPLTLLLRRLSARRFNALPSPLRQGERINSFKAERGRIVRGATKATRRLKESKHLIEEEDNSHIMWWKEKMQTCKKPSSIQLVKRLNYSNLLGLDVSLKNGSLKEGTLNMELLQFKSKFPREVLLCRVGDFYEAVGFDACILVEHAGLNPFGGLRSDSIPRAGCPVMNLRQTLVDLTRNGFSVCIVEEIQGPTQARTRKSRFISGHAHPGSPYVFGLAGVDHDVDFPEPMPVVGISRSAKGYCMISVLETMKTFSVEDGLTEEAIVTKLRTCCYHYLFLHTSLRHNSSGTSRWGEFGEGGLLWGECNGKHFEWFDGTPVNELLYKVRELYGIDQEATFRNVTVSSEKRPRPLYLGTATQIGAIPTEGIPSLLKVLLPSNCFGLPVLYIRDLLLNPPPYVIASAKLERFPQAQDCLLPMGITSENVAQRFGITREEQDQAAVASHKKAAAATASGKFRDEIIPVATKIVDAKTGGEKQVTISVDDGIRPNTSLSDLAKLKPAFKEGGTTTAGNSSQVSDGAGAVLLMKRSLAMQKGLPILGVFRSFAAVGVDPAVMGIGPAVAIPAAVQLAGLEIKDIDLFEINEAFSSQFVYCCKKLELDPEKVNVNGGAMALGHPLGATGARCVGTLLHEMKRRGKDCRFGVISMCIGTGMGAAAVFEAGDCVDELTNACRIQSNNLLSNDAL